MNDQVFPVPAASPVPSSGPPRRKRPQSVLVVVCTQGGEFLLLRRIRPSGFWQSITGSLNPGETPRQAAMRELWEETGLWAGGGLIDLHQSTLFPIIPRWRHRYAPNVCFNREYRFALILPSRRLVRLNPREHSAYHWLRAAEAAALTGSWTNRTAIKHLAAAWGWG
ncbi:dihydroneopterin triphosphate diphosphatase [Caldichromatium japonicum]|uniref:Dihydroneopterin triphosphate diphosphatase n=1 Tax=Caldichromatium japonicum TaxID=2699430 RepID=A0A6G7VC90_9GAMM|nr:dihydroneopterin triphosphate diphosphatase [Caldichromatium japonicum]QIK37468.1 dihydroneopterin triphosphate diphosphatase [Caldichromatium japonicum]